MQKKRRHLPLRQLLNKAGTAAQAIKPVFMMSPLSVSQYLEPGAIEFDILLIDEASQVRPVEALGAAARCRQMIVVGDDKQMPPTQFFGVTIGDIDLDDGESPAMQAGDVESILGLCIARNMPQRMLRWHYRSKHESLIAVSNREFYENRLYVIPSAYRTGELGVKWHPIEGGMFKNGKNEVEAKVVAEHIMLHAKERPKWTLGVAAFSVSQRDAIIKELEALRKQDNSCENFFDPNAPDPFFVKNLENVQGDERDVIFVSVGYGPGEDGKVSLNFGPVSSSGGERRLNVLMTRAKRRCEMFSSMRAEDIDVNRVTGKGPVVFREYLRFAQNGAVVTGADSGASGDRLVDVLQKQLAAKGYEVQTHVGIAGVFVDLAVVDPDNSDRYLLGIDIDGESYKASRSARDRDRTRHAVLGSQGWKMHRIWSLEWFKRPKEKLNELVSAIEDARRAKSASSSPGNKEYQVQRTPGGPDPLSTAVADALPVPDRPVTAPPSDHSQGPSGNDAGGGSLFGEIAGSLVKAGLAAATAQKGKGLEAAIKTLGSDKKGGKK
ncbi:MAG: AAA domain-containing protein [Planctomycetaceae bacterium]